jgi:hypothetical protein
MFRTTFCLCLSFALFPVARADAPAFSFEKGKSALAIPFELNSNKIYLPVRVNGGAPRWFILDSGCPVTAVDLELARELKLPVENLGAIGGAGEGRTQRGDTKVRSLSLPGLELRPTRVWALGVNKPVSPFEGRRIDGLLGVDFLDRFVVRIDYPNRKLDVIDPSEHAPAKEAIAVPLERFGGHWTVRATLQPTGGKPVEGKFILDIGVRLPLMVNTPFVNRHDLIEVLGATRRATVGGGLGGEVIHHLARLKSIQVGGLEVKSPYVSLSQDSKSLNAAEDFDGILGAEVFRRYRFTLDFPGKRVLFEKTAEANKPYEFDASGMFLVARGKDFRTFEVLSVTQNSPASDAGIRKGDVIVAVDGRPAASLTLEKLRASFRDVGATRKLTLQHGDEKKVVKIGLRRLV